MAQRNRSPADRLWPRAIPRSAGPSSIVNCERSYFLSVAGNLSTTEAKTALIRQRIVRMVEVGLESEPKLISEGVAKHDNWWDFCPICNSKLVNQKCKYVCPKPECHFFMSCSEFDL